MPLTRDARSSYDPVRGGARALRVALYTENYEVGGCDRFLVDLARSPELGGHELLFVGNPNPDFDEYLRRRAPQALPRRTVAVANLRAPLFGRAARAAQRMLGRGGGAATPDEPAEAAHRTTLADRVSGVLRLQQAVTNYLRLRRVFCTLRPDVLHINNGGYPGGESCRVAALAARAAGVPRIVHFVHNMAYPPPWPAPLERWLDRRVDRVTDAWATAARRASDALHRQRAIPRDRIATVHYGLPVAPTPARDERLAGELGLRDDRPTLAVVASFDARKGHLDLFEALAGLRREGWRARTLLIGTGARQPLLEERVAARGLADDVAFLGWREDVAAILALSDALVLPSTGHECLPYAILEAMQSGLPVVSTDVAGIPEMVEDGGTGRVVAPADPAALGAALRDVLDDSDRRAALGAAGRERVAAEFGVELMARRVLALWGDQPPEKIISR